MSLSALDSNNCKHTDWHIMFLQSKRKRINLKHEKSMSFGSYYPIMQTCLANFLALRCFLKEIHGECHLLVLNSRYPQLIYLYVKTIIVIEHKDYIWVYSTRYDKIE